MSKSIAIIAAAIVVSMTAIPAHANNLGGKRNSNTNVSSGGLVNVSPSIQTGNLNVLSGTSNGILNGSSVLAGNNTGVGILGTGTGLLKSVTSIVTTKSGKKR